MNIRIFGRVIYIRPLLKYGIITAAVCIVACLGYFLKNGPASDFEPEPLQTAQLPTQEADNVSPSPIAEISVYIIGAIQNPGVIRLPRGSLVEQAVQAAGGFTEDSDREAVNLVHILNENTMLRIPSVTDSDKSFLPKTEEAPSGSTSAQGIININTATLQQLCTLPGIGESTAQKIIDYRTENGAFQSPEEIKNIRGIKDAKYESIKDFICV